MSYYKVKVIKVKKKLVYYLAVILFIFNITGYSFVFYYDMKASENVNLSYKNLLKPETKIILSKDYTKIPLKLFLKKIIPNEYNVYFIYPLFIEFLMKKRIDTEIKYNLIVYSVDILQKIKKSSLFYDLKIWIYYKWGYSDGEIKEMIEKSLETDSDLMNHKLFFNKELIKKYSDYIIKIYKPKNLKEKTSFFNYLIRTTNYKEIVNYINNNEINVNKIYLDKTLAKNIVNMGDFKKSETLLKDFLRKYKKDYLYYYLYLLYKKNKKYDKALHTLEKIKNFTPQNGTYMVALAKEYYENKVYEKALNTLLEAGNDIVKKYCYRYIDYTKSLNAKKQGLYLEKVKNICEKRLIYKALSDYYFKIGDKDKYNFYNLELNLFK